MATRQESFLIHRSLVKNLLFLYLNQLIMHRQTFACEFRYNALPPQSHHRQNQSFLGHQQAYNVMKMVVPYEQWYHKRLNHHVDDIYRLRPQQHEQIFGKVYSNRIQLHALRIKPVCEQV